MTSSALVWEIRLERTAIALGVAALCVAFVAVLWLRFDTAVAKARLTEVERSTLRTQSDNADLNKEIEQVDATIKRIVADINEELRRRKELEIVMADVLARVKMLREEEDKFAILRSEVEANLKRMAEYYRQTKSLGAPDS